ncbi:P-loop containing nucleoside triphosphate hydrolase protein [Daldinia caldariorum]|uniref:P-loop containing nucleoside triphosphate hydrolase protein n=1 Tax=Daldinia caldariorum TaxID=326644 RepID=UPI00200769E8|nr:P-loop containing nucleoside triphosphate hydrolase protein [Daldinia caldariorum]KAI1468827.1 P-loop containing nucleoside triphosphate hydrolase protein [Daldinia caldariorum]
MDPTTAEERLQKTEERPKNLEKIALIGIEAQATATEISGEEFKKAKELVLEILEENQEITYDIESSTAVDNAQLEEILAQLNSEREKNSELQISLEDSRKVVQTLTTTIRDIQGNIRVLCRIRPATKNTPAEDVVDFGPELKSDYSQYWGRMAIPTTRKNVTGAVIPDKPKEYHFERVFSTSDTNEDVFNHISDLVVSSMEGNRVVMLAYGQTGSGKTFTLTHKGVDSKEDGVIPRALALMFETYGQSTGDVDHSIEVSIQELYLNKIYDLLQVAETENREEGIIHANTSKKVPLYSFEQALLSIEDAMSYREVSSTGKNETESGILSVVDLAGSERPNEMQLVGNLRDEGIGINQSLMSLIKLIHSIGAGINPTYDTQLVKVLRPFIVPESKVVMFVMISPLKTDLHVSFQTLEKGQEASKVKMSSVGKSQGPSPSPRPRPGPSPRPVTPTPSNSSGRGTSPSRGNKTPVRGGQSSRTNSPLRGHGRN